MLCCHYFFKKYRSREQMADGNTHISPACHSSRVGICFIEVKNGYIHNNLVDLTYFLFICVHLCLCNKYMCALYVCCAMKISIDYKLPDTLCELLNIYFLFNWLGLIDINRNFCTKIVEKRIHQNISYIF